MFPISSQNASSTLRVTLRFARSVSASVRVDGMSPCSRSTKTYGYVLPEGLCEGGCDSSWLGNWKPILLAYAASVRPERTVPRAP
jgi:hypothetical protein